MTADDRSYGAQLGEVLRQRSVAALREFLEAQAGKYGGEQQAAAIRAQTDAELELILHRMTLARGDLADLHAESERWLAAQGGASPQPSGGSGKGAPGGPGGGPPRRTPGPGGHARRRRPPST